jgi:uncharacterized protein
MQAFKKSWLGALAALAVAAGSTAASDVLDTAGLFQPQAVAQAEARLNQIERETGVPARIETIAALDGQPMSRLSEQRARRWGKPGVYVLITRDEKRIEARDFQSFLGKERRGALEAAFAAGARNGGVDKGLAQLVDRVGTEVRAAGPPRRAGAPPAARPAPPNQAPARSSGMPILIILGLVIVGVLLLGRVFGRNRAYTPPYAGDPNQPPGGPGAMPQAGYGPGYGMPQRGGFWSGVLGGLGGAMAGNWLYDQMSGRHHHNPQSPGAFGADAGAAGPPPEGDAVGGGDTGGTSWGGDAGGDWGGGGDFGGGDFGGGDGW